MRKALIAVSIVIFSVVFCAFPEETTPLSFPSVSDSFDPDAGGSLGFRIKIVPTSIPPVFVIYGGADLNYGSIGLSGDSSLEDVDEEALNTVVVNGSVVEDDIKVLVKVVQYNTAHCLGAYSITVTATPMYLDGVLTNDHTAAPTIEDGSLTPTAIFSLDVDSDGVADLTSSVPTVSGENVTFNVSYATGNPIPPVYDSNGAQKELIIGSFTYMWGSDDSLTEGTYNALITMTYTTES